MIKRGSRAQAFIDAIEKAVDRDDLNTVGMVFYILSQTGHIDEMIDFMPQKVYQSTIDLLLHQKKEQK